MRVRTRFETEKCRGDATKRNVILVVKILGVEIDEKRGVGLNFLKVHVSVGGGVSP